MIHIRYVTVGKIKTSWISEGIDHFDKLLSRYATLSEITVKEEKQAGDDKKEQVIKAESERLLATINPDSVTVVLDERGKVMTSPQLAKTIDDYAVSGRGKFDFVIGSAFGLSAEIIARADLHLSLSRLTFPHELTRLLLAEQLYRAGNILAGGKYHK